MTGNIVELKSRAAIVHDSVVKRLEELLEQARRGDLVMVAVAGVNADDELVQSWSESYDFGRMLGSIARLQHRMNILQDEVQDD